MHETSVWVEVTTLVIAGHNDTDAELQRMAERFAGHLGPDVPPHFSAFQPDFRMRDSPATPPPTLTRARDIALEKGLHHV